MQPKTFEGREVPHAHHIGSGRAKDTVTAPILTSFQGAPAGRAAFLGSGIGATTI